MAATRAAKFDGLSIRSWFLVIFLVLSSLAAYAQVSAGGQRHGASARTWQKTKLNASDASLFLPVVTYPAGIMPNSVAIADVNGDGIPDLVIADSYSSNTGDTNGAVSVLLGNGDGTFQSPVTYDSGGLDATSVAVADVNGDGKPDLLVTNYWAGTGIAHGSVSVFLGNGDGTFQPPVSYSAGLLEAYAVAVADLNGDGKPDLIVINGRDSAGVLLGNGDGTFRDAVNYLLGGVAPSGITVADVNGDWRPDILVSEYGANALENNGAVVVLLGKGDGTFGPAAAYSSGGFIATSVAVADVNGDGKPDLFVGNWCPVRQDNCPSGVVGVLLGNGDGTFQPAVAHETTAYVTSLAVADVNGDGNIDVITANEVGSVGVLLGNGDGTFQLVQTFSSGSAFAVSVAVADLNDDGKPDVAVANTYGSVGVLLNNTAFQTPTTTALASSLNPSAYGQPVTFTVQVTSNSGTPTGTVQILNGSTVVGSGTLANGSVSIPVSTLPAGSDSITASYLGGGGFAASKSLPLTQTVTKAATTTSLSSSLNPAGTGQAVTLTATVTGQYGDTATGTVNFMAGSQSLGSATLSGSVAALTTSFATSGTYSITAQYRGDSNNTGSLSAALSEKIIASTTTTLTSSLNPSVVGQAVIFTATVASSGGMPPNGETITFYNGSTVMGTAPLSGGAAALTTSALPVGVFTITASFPGDSNFAASTSPGLRQVVNSTTKYPTATTLVSSLNPSIYGQKVIFTAAVTTSGPLAPTGNVVFKWSGYTIGSATLDSSGIATLTKSNLNADPYPLTAVYKGDTNNLGSTSPVLNQTVLQTTSAATISSSLNPSAQGQAVTFTAKVTSPTVTPTGPVTFKAGTTVLGTVQLGGGKASYTTTSLPAGSTVVKVIYNGDSNIKGSSAAVTQVVQP